MPSTSSQHYQPHAAFTSSTGGKKKKKKKSMFAAAAAGKTHANKISMRFATLRSFVAVNNLGGGEVVF